MLDEPKQSFIIIGRTQDGERFRPSDWAERLCGVMSAFGSDRRMAYSPYVRPGSHESEKCVYVVAQLYSVEPMAYNFLISFANDNGLELLYTPEVEVEVEAKLA